MTSKRLARMSGANGCIVIGLLLILGWPGTRPAFAERASDRAEERVAELPDPLGNTSKAVLLCDRRDSERPVATLVERAFEKGRVMPISSYDDDPFVQDSIVECMDASGFARGPDGRLILSNARVLIQDELRIFRLDQTGDEEQSGEFKPFAINPWPAPTSNADGSFRFPDEPRFPLFTIERGADGKPILRDGLQVWTPNNFHRGMTTTFEAANKVKDAAEDWSGRHLAWGVDEILAINAHAFIDFNAFYSPSARMLFFGVVPYRLPPPTNPIKIFEMATSWEVAGHESGHAIHHVLKPNNDQSDVGFRTWGESFADQTEMWTSLRDPGRVRAVLADTNGDLSGSNALSRIGEAFGALTGGTSLRDAVNDHTVSTTSPEVHDRSEVLTGALYRLFVSIYGELKRQNRERALEEAGAIMGTFLTGAADYTPENTLTLEDVGKAYLKVDKEFFGGRFHDRIVAELTRREIFDADSVTAWLAHEAALPHLRLHRPNAQEEVDALVQTNLDRLGIGPDFGLIVQSVIRENQHGQTIVRVQLTEGRGASAVPLDNHGILVFRANGRLADYHAPLPPDVGSHALAMALIDHGRRLGLDRHGAPLSIVGRADGQMTAEARVLRGDRLNVWLEAFTVANPHGERREVVSRSWATGAKADLLRRAGTILTPKQLEQ